MGKRNKHNSKHHVIPRSRGGDSSLENITELNVRDHRDYHALFVNKTPDEIVEHLVKNYWNGDWSHVDKAYRRNNGTR